MDLFTATVATETQTRNVSDIVWREDLYPRFEPNPSVIQQYAESLDQLPPVEVNQHNELIDGYHRWTAHKVAKEGEIAVTVTETASDREFLRLAIQRNSKHGLQLSNEEKKSLVLRLYTGKTEEKEEFVRLFSVSLRTIARWTSRRDKDLKAERDRKIADMWLACYTDDEIADSVGCGRSTVTTLMKDPSEIAIWQKLTNLSRYQDPDWSPPLYNVWKTQNKSNATSHFGNSEASFTDNLLYMYTEPFDIVVDPFAGGGATIDVCKRRLRRYWASDRKPTPVRRDIREWDILDGPPPLYNRWGDVALLYLDPPYWKQAEGQYSDDPQDLANMELDAFYERLGALVGECGDRMQPGSHIALLIQPTQWNAPGRQVIDHVMDLVQCLTSDKLRLEMRISCPYESQQCTAQQVEWAKENRTVLVISREIIIWRVAE